MRQARVGRELVASTAARIPRALKIVPTGSVHVPAVRPARHRSAELTWRPHP